MKRVMTLCAAVLLLVSALVPSAMAAENAEVFYPRSVTVSEDKTELRKIYDLAPENDPAGIARSDFEQNGFHYSLVDILRQELPEIEERFTTETVTIPSDKKDMESVLALLPQEREFVTDDGLVGTLSLRLDSVKVEVSGYGSCTRELTAKRTYPNLAGQDTAYIPKTIEDNGKTLTLTDIQWQTDNTASVDGYAIGDRFTAVATYSGSTSASYVKGYTVTADYTGTVSHIALNRVRYVAVFEGCNLNPKPEPAEEPEMIGKPEPTVEPEPAEDTAINAENLAENPIAVVFPWGGVAVVLCVAGALIGGVVVALTVRRRSENESEDDDE